MIVVSKRQDDIYERKTSLGVSQILLKPIIRYVDYNSNAACLLDYTHISTPVKYCLCFNYMILDALA